MTQHFVIGKPSARGAESTPAGPPTGAIPPDRPQAAAPPDRRPKHLTGRASPTPWSSTKRVEALVFGAGYERIADPTCSATTMRRRRDEWIRLGVRSRLRLRLRLPCRDAYDQMIGLDLVGRCSGTATGTRQLDGSCP
jgi:hypothetical protein